MAEVQKRSGAKRVLILFGLFVLFLLGAYGMGRWQGLQATRAAEEATRAAQAATEAAHQRAAAGATQSSQEVSKLQSQGQLLEARRQLHLALMALDERNFGTARDHLQTAGHDLAAVQTPPTGTDPAALSKLSQDLQSARLVATEDLSDQRNQVLTLVRALDAQIPQEPSTPATPEAPKEGSDAAKGPGD